MERYLYQIIAALRVLSPSCGRAYRLGFFSKLKLLIALFRNCRHPGSASSFAEMASVARAILDTSAQIVGEVAEFGCYKGISTANLSLVCKLVNRKLFVFDSFCGLPEPTCRITNIVDRREVQYQKGDLAGSLDEVRSNVARLGCPEVCQFVPGYFDDSLSKFSGCDAFAAIFEDADLDSSVRTVLRYAWPRLAIGGFFFSHEARDLEVVKIFFDDAWWIKNLGCAAPGLIGSGLGLQLSPSGSCLSYIVKHKSEAASNVTPVAA